MAYKEKGIDISISEIKEKEPLVLLFPKSYLEKIAKLSHKKKIDFNFIGILFREEIKKYREPVIPWVKKNFTNSSYFKIMDFQRQKSKDASSGCYKPLGKYDFTLKSPPGFIPKEALGDRTFFDEHYFKVLCASKFTLCPRGDKPWSQRFFEAIMCKSIPIVENKKHSGRNYLERKLPYKYYLTTDKIIYNEDWAEHNYKLFFKKQTLISL